MMKTRLVLGLYLFIVAALSAAQTPATPTPIFGFRDPGKQAEIEKRFLAVPDPKLAEQHLRTLTAAPHVAGSPEDRQTAEYVAQKYREAGLDTQIVEYKIWLNYPAEISVDMTAPAGVQMHGPTREHVDGNDSFQNDPRVLTAFNGYSPSGDVEADVVYANYGRPEDIQKLKELGIGVTGKILVVRYGQNFRGVKAFVAQEAGAAGVIIYSDPIDDGWFKGDKYPKGPWRPDSGVQRGSIGYMFEFAGDPTTPGIASLPGIADGQRIAPERSAQLPKVPTTPLSYHDIWPVLENLAGPASPREWQGALPFTYHTGPGPARVKIHLKQNYGFHPIWNVVGMVKGSEYPDQWVVAGNHRDAWVYGAVDPNSGTTAQLEAVHGIGELLKSGWRPKRTMVFCSWDAEEYGLIGSTEWGEEHARELTTAPAYFNMDVGVGGPNFSASAVPSLKQFIRDVSKAVPSPKGGSVYDVWQAAQKKNEPTRGTVPELSTQQTRQPQVETKKDVPVGDLGSGSDYTVFLQHLGVPSADVGSGGPYGVYHSVFDNFDWFKKFADPTFVYEQQMARVYGLEMLRMASADVLPYDYESYGKEIGLYLDSAQKKAEAKFAVRAPNFADAKKAAQGLAEAGSKVAKTQSEASTDLAKLNRALIQAERGFLINGLPNRPWYKHAIYAPGEYTGYAAVVLPGVNEAIDKGDVERTTKQLEEVTGAIQRATKTLESYGQ